MIDLEATRERMLGELGAREELLGDPLAEPADPAFAARAQARLRVEGGRRSQLLAPLERALSARFPGVPPEDLILDLLYPLKRGLGNAFKRGNGQDPSRRIGVEAVVTGRGALVSVSDEGDGFDVAGVVRDFRERRAYFTHHGGGMVTFERARSAIGWADGGRTLLIRYLRPDAAPPAAPGSAPRELGLAADASFMGPVLAAELPRFRKGKASLEGCRVEVPELPIGDPTELRYVLAVRKRGADRTGQLTLTGRLLPPPAARLDFETARALYEGPFQGAKEIGVAEPFEAFKQHPRLVLYRFRPEADLWSYARRADFREVLRACERVGAGLRAWHDSAVALPRREALAEALEAGFARDERGLARAAGERAGGLRELAQRLRQRALGLRDAAPRPGHGRFGWRSVLIADGELRFYHFEHARAAHPGFDLGGCLADLARFCGPDGGGERAEAARRACLTAYFGAFAPAWREDLPFFAARALLDRLWEPAPGEPAPDAAGTLARCHRLLA